MIIYLYSCKSGAGAHKIFCEKKVTFRVFELPLLELRWFLRTVKGRHYYPNVRCSFSNIMLWTRKQYLFIIIIPLISINVNYWIVYVISVLSSQSLALLFMCISDMKSVVNTYGFNFGIIYLTCLLEPSEIIYFGDESPKLSDASLYNLVGVLSSTEHWANRTFV